MRLQQEATMKQLTSATARELQIGGILRDHEIKGLHLVATVTGKSWLLYYRTRAGIERRPKIGRYPEINLAGAREIAKELKERIARGEDPSADWKASKDVPTVSDLCDRYLSEWARPRLKPKSADQHIQLIEAQIKPGLGSKRVSDVSPGDVDRWLQRVFNREFVDKTDGKPKTAHWTAHHAKKLLSKLFNLAIDYWEIPEIKRNPVRHTQVFARKKRKVHADPEALARISTALAKLTETEPRRAACIWTLFLTGARVNEILQLRGEQIITKADKKKVILLKTHKTLAHMGEKEVVLPKQAADILDRLETIGRKDRVFGRTALRSLQRQWASIREEAQCPDLKLLDARRTFASFGLSNGLTLEQTGELLGHMDTSTTKGYAYLMDEMKHKMANLTAEAIMRAAKSTKNENVNEGA